MSGTLAQQPAPLVVSAPGTPAAIGLQVDDYLITRRIGEGGMGMVYEALQPTLGKRVAIKVLRADRADDPGASAEILAEARAVSAVRHRGVIDVYNVGRMPDGRAYLAMELLEGEPLDRWVCGRGRLTWTRSALSSTRSSMRSRLCMGRAGSR